MSNWRVTEAHDVIADSPEEALEKVHGNLARFVSATIVLRGTPEDSDA